MQSYQIQQEREYQKKIQDYQNQQEEENKKKMQDYQRKTNLFFKIKNILQENSLSFSLSDKELMSKIEKYDTFNTDDDSTIDGIVELIEDDLSQFFYKIKDKLEEDYNLSDEGWSDEELISKIENQFNSFNLFDIDENEKIDKIVENIGEELLELEYD